MSANNLASSNEFIGYNGRGTFNHSGGTNSIAAGTGFLDVGVFSGPTGTYNLSGTGRGGQHAGIHRRRRDGRFPTRPADRTPSMALETIYISATTPLGIAAHTH